MLAAVVFDFDGIIVDSEPMHHRAFQRLLEPLGMGIPWEDYCETYIGFDDRDALKTVFKAHSQNLDSKDLKRMIEQKAGFFHELVLSDKVTPLPGAVELIKSIPAQFPSALCSGALREDILPILENLDIKGAFNAIVTAEETIRSKPDPAPYSLVLEKLGINDPATVIAIEDTPTGIMSAKGAGLNVLAVTNSYDREYLFEANAIVDSLEEVTLSSLENLVS